MRLNLIIEVDDAYRYMNCNKVSSEVIKHLNELGYVSLRNRCHSYTDSMAFTSYTVSFSCKICNSSSARVLYKRLNAVSHDKFTIKDIGIDCI